MFSQGKSTNQKSCTQSVLFVPCGRGLCLDFGARCAQDSSEDGFVRTETRKLSKTKFPSPLAKVWGHLRQEVPHTAGKTDPVKKNTQTLKVSKKKTGLRRSSLEPFAARSAHSGKTSNPMNRIAGNLRVSPKKNWSSLTRVWDHLRQEVSQTARRTDPVGVSRKTFRISLAQVWGHCGKMCSRSQREKTAVWPKRPPHHERCFEPEPERKLNRTQ